MKKQFASTFKIKVNKHIYPETTFSPNIVLYSVRKKQFVSTVKTKVSITKHIYLLTIFLPNDVLYFL